jgi:hypothetical protein
MPANANQRWKTAAAAIQARRRPLFWLGLALILGLYFFLILPGLGELTFWNDESATAVFTLNTLQRGLPYVDYGLSNLEVGPFDANFLHVESAHGWLQYAVCSLGFGLLGVSEWNGRLPFVLIGGLIVALTALLGRRLYGWVSGLFGALVLAIQPQYLQYCRECRYYVLVMGIFLGTMSVYLLVRDGRLHWFWLCVCALLAFHATQLLPPPLFGALFCYDLLARGWARKKNLPWNGPIPWVRVIVGCAALVIPCFLFLYAGRTGLLALYEPAKIPHHLAACFLESAAFYPFLLLLGALPLASREYSYFPVWMALLSCVLLSLFPHGVFYLTGGSFFYRYFVWMLPVGAVICGRGLALWRRQAIVLLVATALIAPLDGLADFQKVRDQFRDRYEYYRHPPQPNPQREALRIITDLTKTYPTVVIEDVIHNLELIYYLGRKVAVKVSPADQTIRPAGAYIVVKNPWPDERNVSDVLLEGCVKKTYGGIGLFWQNHPESPPHGLESLTMTIWQCPARDAEIEPPSV